MSEFKVDPDALQRFVTGATAREGALNDVRQRLHDVRLSRGSFGYVPGIGNRVHDAYEEFVDGCTEAVTSAAESMASIADAVESVVESYRTSDQAAEQSHRAIQSVELRGMG